MTFNQSAKPFESLKDYVSYYRGLDHAGGWALGGHSSGDVFATGADMVGTQKTNSISIDQVAANVHGHPRASPGPVSEVPGLLSGGGALAAARRPRA